MNARHSRNKKILIKAYRDFWGHKSMLESKENFTALKGTQDETAVVVKRQFFTFIYKHLRKVLEWEIKNINLLWLVVCGVLLGIIWLNVLSFPWKTPDILIYVSEGLRASLKNQN